MITALRGVPDELAHQRRRLGLGSLEFAPHISTPRVSAEKDGLSQVVPGFRKQRCGRNTDVSLI
jgi:hypothetical protein